MRSGVLFLVATVLLSTVRCVKVTTLSDENREETLRKFFLDDADDKGEDPQKDEGGHTNNWAVIVGASKFWFNYRHTANALGIYRTVRRLGIPDSQVILMLADDVACNPRNGYPGQVYVNPSHDYNLYGESIEVDYRGTEVTVENFLRVLEGRHDPDVPKSKRLGTDSKSNVLVYLTGHGGGEFLKFQDTEELTSADLADSLAQMHEKGRYHELLIAADTCRAGSLFNKIRSKGILSIGSSNITESSYSYREDGSIGISVIDRFTYHTLEWFSSHDRSNPGTLAELFGYYTYSKLSSHAVWYEDWFDRSLKDVPSTDFFGSNIPCKITKADEVASWWDTDDNDINN